MTPDYDTRPEKPLATTFPVKVGENIVATLGRYINLDRERSNVWLYGRVLRDDDTYEYYAINQWLDKDTLLKIKKDCNWWWHYSNW